MAVPLRMTSPDGGQSAPPRRGVGGSKARGRGQAKVRDTGKLYGISKFAYQYCSDIAWDTERLVPCKLANLAHTFGRDAYKAWMGDDLRRVVMPEQVVFEPGAELPEGWLNLFSGLPVKPVPGDCSVMLELLNHLCSASTGPDGVGPEDVADWVLQWCAYPLQNLGAKMDTALIFHGPQGTGKNLFFDVLRDLYGEYGVMVGQTEIEDKYNAWISRRMFIIGDEVVSRQEMYHAKNRLKWIVTQKTKIPIRAMQMDTRWESNHANLVFLSNESTPLAIEDGDRRYLVVFTPSKEEGDLYARVGKFLAEGGAAKWLHHLLTIPLDGFNERTKPLMTEAKEALVEACHTPSQRFADEWLKGFLPLPMRVCSAEQLYKAAQRWAVNNGERYLPQQAIFTTQVCRFVAERVRRDKQGAPLPAPLTYKVVTLKYAAETGKGRKSVRCWVPEGCKPPDGVSEGEWAAESIQSFAKDLADFIHADRLHESGDV